MVDYGIFTVRDVKLNPSIFKIHLNILSDIVLRYVMRSLVRRQLLYLLGRCLCTAIQNDSKVKTAGIIVIGDEILKGEVVDTNSSYMTPKLREIGVQVKKISVIGDNVDEISEEVQIFSSKYNYVITAGGIGPTHDDMTFEAISKAFKEPLVLHPELFEMCCRFYNTKDVNAPGMKLARVPQSAKLTFAPGPKLNYPNVNVRNVFIFPGIPQLFQKSFSLLHKHLFQSSAKFYSKTVYFNVNEDKIVTFLEELVNSCPNVIFGSYPDIANKDYTVKVTLESTQKEALEFAHKKLLATVPENFMVKLGDSRED